MFIILSSNTCIDPYTMMIKIIYTSKNKLKKIYTHHICCNVYFYYGLKSCNNHNKYINYLDFLFNYDA
jgi:hypothetical protein